jgi:hypothetical protein
VNAALEAYKKNNPSIASKVWIVRKRQKTKDDDDDESQDTCGAQLHATINDDDDDKNAAFRRTFSLRSNSNADARSAARTTRSIADDSRPVFGRTQRDVSDEDQNIESRDDMSEVEIQETEREIQQSLASEMIVIDVRIILNAVTSAALRTQRNGTSGGGSGGTSGMVGRDDGGGGSAGHRDDGFADDTCDIAVGKNMGSFRAAGGDDLTDSCASAVPEKVKYRVVYFTDCPGFQRQEGSSKCPQFAQISRAEQYANLCGIRLALRTCADKIKKFLTSYDVDHPSSSQRENDGHDTRHDARFRHPHDLLRQTPPNATASQKEGTGKNACKEREAEEEEEEEEEEENDNDAGENRRLNRMRRTARTSGIHIRIRVPCLFAMRACREYAVNWQRMDWRTTKNEPAPHKDILKQILDLVARLAKFRCRIQWIYDRPTD